MKHLHLKELRRVLALMGEMKWKFYLSCFLTVASVTGLVMINSFMSKKVINGVVYGQKDLLFEGLLLMLLAIFMVCVVSPVTGYLGMYYAKKTIFQIRSNLYSHILSLPVQYFHAKGSGELLSRLTNDLSKFEAIYERELYQVIESFAIGCGSTIVVFILDWRLAVVTVVLGGLTFLANTLYARPLRDISGKVQSLLGGSTQRFLDLLAGNRVVKLFNINQHIAGKFSAENGKAMEESIRLSKKEAEKDGVSFLLAGAFFVGVFGAGVFMVSRGMTDMGTVVAIFALRLGVDDLFSKFGGSLVNMQKSLAGVGRVFELMDISEEYLKMERYELTSQAHALVFDKVTFTYNGSKEVLQGVNLSVKKHQTAALVGVSGAGKSTIFKLLLGLYAPTDGKISLINHTGSEAISPAILRSQFAYVAQDAYLFDTTIEENIRFGRPNATREEIIEAAKAANAHEFISNLPDGYETRVGENSTCLSGGQKQRISIARAFLKDASILLLDEATSALDPESEALVQDALRKIKQGRTTLVIAHRLSTIQNADVIYVLDEGKVVQQGRHKELLEGEGVYRGLYQAQFALK